MFKRIAILPLLVLAGLLLSFCGGKEIPEIAVTASDFAFNVPQSIVGGPVRFRFDNAGKEPHHMQIMSLKPGATMEQVQAAFLRQDEAGAIQLLSLLGGPGVINPGAKASVVLDLKPGDYLFVCFVPGADGLPHMAKGMLSAVTVTQPEGDAPSLPKFDGTATLKDFAFELPEIKSGPMVLNVVNQGPQPHELVLVRPAEGKKAQDVLAWLQNPATPPPFQFAGGMQGLDAGASGVLEIDLAPGQYAALCFIPDPASGLPHAGLGMIKEFTVK